MYVTTRLTEQGPLSKIHLQCIPPERVVRVQLQLAGLLGRDISGPSPEDPERAAMKVERVSDDIVQVVDADVAPADLGEGNVGDEFAVDGVAVLDLLEERVVDLVLERDVVEPLCAGYQSTV
jgi:hypothetical protein